MSGLQRMHWANERTLVASRKVGHWDACLPVMLTEPLETSDGDMLNDEEVSDGASRPD